MRFGLLPFRSPLLRESLLISFPGLLRWFTSPSFASVPYFIQVFRCWNRSQRVTPFGYLRLIEYVLLPAAFRSLSRPSSPYSSIGIRHRPIFRLTILFFLFRICILSAALMPSSSAFLPLACNATPSPYQTVLPVCLILSSFTCHFKEPEVQNYPSDFFLEIRGFEPLTLGLQSRCSSQLSYIPAGNI